MKFIALIVALILVIAAPWIITDAFYVHLMIMVLMWTVPGRVPGISWEVSRVKSPSATPLF